MIRKQSVLLEQPPYTNRGSVIPSVVFVTTHRIIEKELSNQAKIQRL